MGLFSIPAFLLFLFFACSLAYLAWQANIEIPEKDVLFRVEANDRALVTRNSANSVHIAWPADMNPQQITLSYDPQFKQSTPEICILPGQTSLELSGVHTVPRPYFKLHTQQQNSLSLAERVLPFEKINNFRDLGGYQTTQGQTVKWGLVYRSGHLGNPDAADMELLQDLGIKTIIDLRSASEHEKHPDVTLPGANYLQIPLFRSDPFPFTHIVFQRHKLGKRLEDIYTHWVIDGSAKELGKIFRLMSDPANLPVVIHCTAGKDRTGITAALLLLALGVNESTAVFDYTLSNCAADRFLVDYQQPLSFVRFLGIKQEHFYPIIATPPQMMEATIHHIKRKYGSVRNYLVKTACVPEEILCQLMHTLLEG